jgi:hypothetical protein
MEKEEGLGLSERAIGAASLLSRPLPLDLDQSVKRSSL